MTGYEADEVLGRNCRFLQGPETDPARVDELRRAVREQRPATVELRNHRATAARSGTRSTSRPCATSAARSCASSASRSTSPPTATGSSQERRSAFLAEASPLLDASLDLRSTLDSLTRLSVPFLGDVCIVDEIRLNEVRRLSAAAADPAVERLVRELPSRYPVHPGDPIARVLETGRGDPAGAGSASSARGDGGPAAGRLRARGDARPAEGARAHHRARRLRLAGPRAPLRPGRPRCWPRTSPGAPRSRSTTRGSTRTSARSRAALQAALLPQRLPELVGVELAARFRPAGDGSLIGGDFYDVLPLGRRRRPRDRRRHRQGRAGRRADVARAPHGPHRRALRASRRAACWTSSTAR